MPDIFYFFQVVANWEETLDRLPWQERKKGMRRIQCCSNQRIVSRKARISHYFTLYVKSSSASPMTKFEG